MIDAQTPFRRLMDTRPEDVTILALLDRRAAETPDREFFSLGDATQTIGDFRRAVDVLARNLMNRNIARGTHVAVVMDTSIDYLHLWFALARVGAVEVPINTAYRGDLLVHALNTCQATTCFIDESYLANLHGAIGHAPAITRLIVNGPGTVPPGFATDVASFDDFRLDLDAAKFPFDAICYADIGGVIFTSGTTGPSKGVMLSHHYLAAYGYMYAEINSLDETDVIFNYLPFFHIGAKFLTIATLVCGGRMRLSPRLSITGFWDEVRTHGVTNFVAVGGICNMLLGRRPEATDAETTIRTVYAVPDPVEVHHEFERRFACKLTTVYGSTETGLPLFRGVDDPYFPGSCGQISRYYDVQIVDELDQPVAVGETGEIVVRGKRPYLTGSGYIGMPERTVAAWRNLWLHSGDRAAMSADGAFFFRDRAADYIRRRGENISSFEIETIVSKHPAVAEVAAVPAASDMGEDEVWILVCPRDGKSVTTADLLLHCNDHMPYFMIPRFIDIVAEFPRTPTAKIEKYKLRDAGPGPATWDRDANGWVLTREGVSRAG